MSRIRRNTGKAMLLKMAVKGLKKPSAYTKEYELLYRWLRICPVFRTKMAQVRPDWIPQKRLLGGILKPSRNTGEMARVDILDMADAGMMKPHYNSKEGRALYYLCRRNPDFNTHIRALRPDWFKNATK